MSGVKRMSTPCRSRASSAPSQYPSKTSCHGVPLRIGSVGEKSASAYTQPRDASSSA